MRPIFDDRDQELLNARIAIRDTFDGPRIGDWVKMPNGEYYRFTHDWGDAIQTTAYAGDNIGGFYLGKGGGASFSGSLAPSIPKDCLQLTDEVKNASFWFFHHDYAQAHSGVHCNAPCRVYKLITK